MADVGWRVRGEGCLGVVNLFGVRSEAMVRGMFVALLVVGVGFWGRCQDAGYVVPAADDSSEWEGAGVGVAAGRGPDDLGKTRERDEAGT